MLHAQSTPKSARRGLWLSIAVVGCLLGLTTWDVLRNSGGSSPVALRRAAFDGDEATVRRLIAAHPEWIDLPGSTNAQMVMLSQFYSKAVEVIGKPTASTPTAGPETDFRELESLGATPLFHAVARKHLGTTRALTEARANVRAKLSTGLPLVILAAYLGDTNLLSVLEARGATLGERDPVYARSLLHHAVYSGQEEVLRFLLARGHSVNQTNSTGDTPLHFAVVYGRLSFVQLFATNGADLAIANSLGQTALDVARHRATKISHGNRAAIVTWLEAYTATNQPPAKPVP